MRETEGRLGSIATYRQESGGIGIQPATCDVKSTFIFIAFSSTILYSSNMYFSNVNKETCKENATDP